MPKRLIATVNDEARKELFKLCLDENLTMQDFLIQAAEEKFYKLRGKKINLNTQAGTVYKGGQNAENQE